MSLVAQMLLLSLRIEESDPNSMCDELAVKEQRVYVLGRLLVV